MTQPITIRRSAALGDVIAATSVAIALMDKGHRVIQTSMLEFFPVLVRITQGVHVENPYLDLQCVGETPRIFDVDLDNTYETHPDRKTKSIHEIYGEAANQQLEAKGIQIDPRNMPLPKIGRSVPIALEVMLSHFPKPWVMIIPKSGTANRSLPASVWQQAAKDIRGTCFWTGTGIAPEGIKDLRCDSYSSLMDYLSAADVVAGVDTGPMHIANAMGIPLVVIGQAVEPALRYSGVTVLYPPLDCLNCQEATCPINAQTPPCTQIDTKLIAEAVNEKLTQRAFGKQ